jgi:polyphenol oxidase
MTVDEGFRWTEEPWGRALRSDALLEAADHFFSTRQLWLRGESESADWAAAAASIGVSEDRLQRLRQVHGRAVAVCRNGVSKTRESADRQHEASAGGGCANEGTWPEADIVLSDDPAIALAIQVADCVPLLMADRGGRVVAGVHAGWRGTAVGAAGTAVEAMRSEFGVRPDDLIVSIGPSIGRCCYEVGAELLAAFAATWPADLVERWFSRDGTGRLVLDLWAANRDQIIAAGVPSSQVHVCRICTASHPEWFASYRRDGPGTGRIAAVIRARG